MIPNVAEKNILILVEEKKNLIQFLSYMYNLMLNSRKKSSCFGNKNINILTLVLSEKKILNETKNHNPPPHTLQVKWSVPYSLNFQFCSHFLILLFKQFSIIKF
jgi:hypothetical protein